MRVVAGIFHLRRLGDISLTPPGLSVLSGSEDHVERMRLSGGVELRSSRGDGRFAPAEMPPPPAEGFFSAAFFPATPGSLVGSSNNPVLRNPRDLYVLTVGFLAS